MDVRGRRITVMGLGTHGGGVGAVRYLAERGAQVTVTDLADESRLGESLSALDGFPLARLRLGQHDEADFRGAEVVIVNPAVRPDNRFIAMARDCGAQITSEVELFLGACPARIIGVTGSCGKSTTATMIAEILQAAGRRTWLGGNIGRSLLAEVDSIAPDDLVVLELSSFQLFWLTTEARLPEVAVVTNLSPNHLDWHGSYAGYVQAKRRILGDPNTRRAVIVEESDPVLRGWRGTVANLVRDWAGPTNAHSRSHDLGYDNPRCDNLGYELNVPGAHNRRNAILAARAAQAVDCDSDSIRRGLMAFAGLPHRLEFLGSASDRSFYNDSKATTPQAVKAALEAIEGRVWLIAGGQSKGASFEPMIEALLRRGSGAAFYGSARSELHDALTKHDGAFPCLVCETLTAAVDWCLQQSTPGDTLLLSPGCTSHDQFADYAQRGRAFQVLVEDFRRSDRPVSSVASASEAMTAMPAVPWAGRT